MSNLVKFTTKVLKKSQFLIIFLQNPVSGPLKRHDGGWKCLIIQKKCQILSNLVEIQSNFVENLVKKLWISRAGQIWVNLLKNTKKGQIFWIFLQNPVSGPHKRHDGGWYCLIIQKKCQILPNLVKYCRKFSQKPGFFFGKFTQKYQKRLFFSQNFDIFFAKSSFRST